MTTTAFEKGGISILQIANAKNAFIFDMRKLSILPQFSQFFFDLLANQKIAKVFVYFTIYFISLIAKDWPHYQR